MIKPQNINGALNMIESLQLSKNRSAYTAALQTFLYMMDFESEEYVSQVFDHYKLDLMRIVEKLDGDTSFDSINTYLKNHNEPIFVVFSMFYDCPIMHKLLATLKIRQSQKWSGIIDRTLQSILNLDLKSKASVIQSLIEDARATAKYENVGYDLNKFYKRITLEFADKSVLDIITNADSTDIETWFAD